MTRTLALLLAALLALSGCSLLGDDGPSPDQAAQEIAAQLSTGDLTPDRFTGQDDPAAWYADLTDGVAAEDRVVDVEQVTESDGVADVRLSWSWTLPTGAVWEYTSTATLTESDDPEPVWTVVAEPALVVPDLLEGESLRFSRQWAPRAEILGADGVALVTEREVLRFGVDKTRVEREQDLRRAARQLADVLEIDARTFAARVEAAGERAFVEAVVLRVEDVSADLGARIEAIDGAVGIRDSLPLAPTRDFARPILGTYGAVTAELVEESDGLYVAGDEAGLSGLQARYDEQLRGTLGAAVSAVNADGERRTVFEQDAVPGEPVRLTLDLDLQERAEQLLADVGPASALVALRPSTGEVLVAASGPGGGGLSTATTGQYAPGSTMKVATSLALLRAGLKPSSPLRCPDTITVDGRRFGNYSDYPASGLGAIDLAGALANSCNTAFIGAGRRVDQGDLANAAASLGLGIDHDLGYPVFLGSVPDEAGSATEAAASLIGQGRVLASPVAMAAVVASVVAGETVTPVLVDGTGPTAEQQPAPLTGGEARALRSLMRGVVTQGSGALLADVPGPPVLAKTGTAEFGERVPPQTHGWMIAAQGDLAVAVFVELAESGSRTAGPILEAFLRSAG